MRYIILILLLATISLLTSCSYITDFVVVNESKYPIEIRCRAKKFPGEFDPRGTLHKILTSKLHSRNLQWQELSNLQYHVDKENRIVLVRLIPGEALRIDRINLLGDNFDAKNFFLEEISIAGAEGEITYKGEQAFRSFLAESKKLRTLTYR